MDTDSLVKRYRSAVTGNALIKLGKPARPPEVQTTHIQDIAEIIQNPQPRQFQPGEPMQPFVLINAVGLTPRLLPFAPRLEGLVKTGWMRPLRGVLPAVTCTAQATMLTGEFPSRHGIVGNGWLFRDTGEVRFWQQ